MENKVISLKLTCMTLNELSSFVCVCTHTYLHMGSINKEEVMCFRRGDGDKGELEGVREKEHDVNTLHVKKILKK